MCPLSTLALLALLPIRCYVINLQALYELHSGVLTIIMNHVLTSHESRLNDYCTSAYEHRTSIVPMSSIYTMICTYTIISSALAVRPCKHVCRLIKIIEHVYAPRKGRSIR